MGIAGYIKWRKGLSNVPKYSRYELRPVEDTKDPIYGLFHTVCDSKGEITHRRIGSICIQLNDRVEVLIPELETFIQLAIKDHRG